MKKKTGKQPFMLSVDDLDAPAIIDFLESLEEQRGNQVCSRNARLTAIRSFFHVVAFRDPGSIGVVGRVLAIPKKRTDKRLVGYLTRDEMKLCWLAVRCREFRAIERDGLADVPVFV